MKGDLGAVSGREPTQRQLEVLKLFDAGYSMPEIANLLGISTGSVKQSLMALRWITGAERARHLPAIARQLGWL